MEGFIMRKLIKLFILPLLINTGTSLAQDHPVADAVAAKIMSAPNSGSTTVVNPTTTGGVAAVHTGAAVATHPAARANPPGTPNTRQFRRTHGAGMNRR